MPGPVARGDSRLHWIGGLAAALWLLAACAPAAPTPSGRSGSGPAASQAQGGATGAGPSQIRLVYPQDFPGMHPYANSSSPDYARWSQIYGTISKYDDEKHDYVPNLAESWSTPDPNTWVIKLRRGVQFHNGNPFTADDVLFSLDRIANDPQSQQAEKVKNIGELTKLDDYTIELKTRMPDAPLMSGLYNVSILNKALHEQLGSEAADRLAIGTGPYMLREWVPGQRLVLARNPNYQGTPMPTIDEVIYRVIPEAEARVTALLNGEADVIFGVAPQHLERIRASGRADVRGALEVRPGFIAMNPTYKPWDDKRMRLAVNYAIDREAIVNGVLAGEGKALYTPVGPNTMGYESGRAAAVPLRTRARSSARRQGPATRTGSTSRWAARSTATSKTKRSARPLPRCSARWASARSSSPRNTRPSSRPFARGRCRSTCSAAAAWSTRASTSTSTSYRVRPNA